MQESCRLIGLFKIENTPVVSNICTLALQRRRETGSNKNIILSDVETMFQKLLI